MARRNRRRLGALLEDAPDAEVFTELRVLRARLILAEILAKPVSQRQDLRDLTLTRHLARGR